jgi:tetratricopeptide (TPR) repeat protein
MKKALQLTQILQHGTAHRDGRLAEAERWYQAVLELKRDDFDSLHLLGVVRWQQRRHDEASQLIKQALRGKLMQNRQNSALFAIERTCRHIEAAYVTMCETYLRGAPACSFRVESN